MRNVVVVLAGTTHPGNIGFCARAMKTMGVDTLRLAAPRAAVDNTAIANATSAADVLDNCSILGDVPAALEGCSAVLAFSARRRQLAPKHFMLREGMNKAAAHLKSGRKVALLFGNERAGLSNEEASHADWLVGIPSADCCPSLNLSHALQVVLYELRSQVGYGHAGVRDDRQHVPASVEYREQMFMHFERVAKKTGMIAEDSHRPFMTRLRLILTRAELDHEEVNMLRGFLTSVEKASSRGK